MNEQLAERPTVDPHPFDHDGTARHHHDDQTGDPVWWLNCEQFGGERRDHSRSERPPVDEGLDLGPVCRSASADGPCDDETCLTHGRAAIERPPVDEGLREALTEHEPRVTNGYEGPAVECSNKKCAASGWDWWAVHERLIRASLAAAGAVEILCDDCRGFGYTVDADPLPSGEPGEPYQVPCGSCGTTGRLASPAAPPEGLDEVQAALPDGWSLMVGYTTECPFCPGWWATASKRPESPADYSKIVTSESDRLRGSHHDATSAEAIRALLRRLSDTEGK